MKFTGERLIPRNKFCGTNTNSYKEEENIENKFHVRELTKDEFLNSLKELFFEVEIYSQR